MRKTQPIFQLNQDKNALKKTGTMVSRGETPKMINSASKQSEKTAADN